MYFAQKALGHFGPLILRPWGRYWSCHFVVLSDSVRTPKNSPTLNRRSMSDPAINRHRTDHLPNAGSPSHSIVPVEPAAVSPEQKPGPEDPRDILAETPPGDFIFGSHKRVGSRKDRRRSNDEGKGEKENITCSLAPPPCTSL